jgi:IS5 family transposase
MLGKQEINTELFQCVTMDALVPANHLLRRLRNAMDLSFVTETVAGCYSKVGRHSCDPQLIARMWILQHFYGYSERQVCEEVTMHAGFRWFCGLSFNDTVPDQSTLVKLRNKMWAKTGLWERLLNETVRACEAAGICRPERMGVDGTQINANAATVSLEAISPELTIVEDSPPAEPPPDSALDIRPHLAVVPSDPRTDEEDQVPMDTDGHDPITETSANDTQAPDLTILEGGQIKNARKSGDPDWHGERFSNATHRSTTDPDARLYRKGNNQEAKLRYLGHYMVDLKSRVIYGAMATHATGTAEREAACALLEQLPTKPKELVADLGYRDGDFLADILDQGVQPIVPIGDEPLEDEPSWTRRTYNLEHHKHRKQKQRAARARNQTRMASAGRRGATAQRQRTKLEHLYGEGKEHHGLGRAHGRGLVRVDQQVKLTATVQNLKRLLSRRPRRGITVVTTDIASFRPCMRPNRRYTIALRTILRRFYAQAHARTKKRRTRSR